MKTRMSIRQLVLISPLLLVTSLGCSLTTVIGDIGREAEPTPTRTPQPTFTPTPEQSAFVDVVVENTTSPEDLSTTGQTETPTASPTATIAPPTVTPAPPTPTETPVEEVGGPPVVTLIQNMNVRTGPGTNYSIAGPGPAGATAPVIGRNTDNSWVQVEYPPAPDGIGWVYADLVQIDGDLGQAAVVQVAPPPTVPPPVQEEAPPPPPPEPQYQFTPTGWHASENAGIVQFKGRIKDEGGNLINGFSILADNGAFSVVSHPTGASVWYPDKGDGEWDIVMPNLRDAQGWWWLTVVRYDCNFAASFDAQCKNFTRLSEDVKVQVLTPEESIINADWICHYECNTGLYVDAFRR